jgi:glycosyltransferase involved in cell wall biosynthesis
MRSSPRVVIVHDYLTQRGGAERVVLAMLEAFPGSRLVTSVYAPKQTFPEFREQHVTELMPWAPGALRKDPRFALPVLARVFDRARVDDADVVLCSTSGWAHGIQSTAPKVVYCHTPARWLHEADEYRVGQRIPVRAVASLARRAFRDRDLRAAASAHTYVVNSTFIAQRVRTAYGRESIVLHPPPGILPDGAVRQPQTVPHHFLLTIARGRAYKNTAAVVEAARRRSSPLIIVGGRTSQSNDSDVVQLVGVDDATLRWLYANCRAVIAAAYEDFGLTPVEGMAFGKPVVALRARGYLDSVVEGRTGVLFDDPSADAIAEAIATLDRTSFDPNDIRRHAATFSRERFASRLHEIAAGVVGQPFGLEPYPP